MKQRQQQRRRWRETACQIRVCLDLMIPRVAGKLLTRADERRVRSAVRATYRQRCRGRRRAWSRAWPRMAHGGLIMGHLPARHWTEARASWASAGAVRGGGGGDTLSASRCHAGVLTCPRRPLPGLDGDKYLDSSRAIAGLYDNHTTHTHATNNQPIGHTVTSQLSLPGRRHHAVHAHRQKNRGETWPGLLPVSFPAPYPLPPTQPNSPSPPLAGFNSTKSPSPPPARASSSSNSPPRPSTTATSSSASTSTPASPSPTPSSQTATASSRSSARTPPPPPAPCSTSPSCCSPRAGGNRTRTGPRTWPRPLRSSARRPPRMWAPRRSGSCSGRRTSCPRRRIWHPPRAPRCRWWV